MKIETSKEKHAKSAQFVSEESRWQAVAEHIPQADGTFVFAVATTGVYCRPTCPSRPPLRKNVRFFDDWRAAEEAGFRPCKRCRPQNAYAPDPAEEVVCKACALIEISERELPLTDLANEVGLSPSHFHRLFKRTTGLTPKQYAAEKRLHRLRDGLKRHSTVTEAIYEAGYESNSRFYEKATKRLGMKPSAYRRGGKGLVVSYSVVRSSFGWLLVAATDRGICRIDFGDTPEIVRARLEEDFSEATLREGDSAFAATVERILDFLEQPEERTTLPLDIQGTIFQRRVWSALESIPPGATATYAEIAERIGRPKAARAVARACATNRLAVLIPCHRVIRGDGELGGYRWGIERKRELLRREAEKKKKTSE